MKKATGRRFMHLADAFMVQLHTSLTVFGTPVNAVVLLQVIKRDGSRGLVPKSYVQVAEEEDDDSDALSLAGGSSAAGAAGGQADLNSFLAR
jgi:hypothetical protein